MSAPLPPDEQARLDRLRELLILDSEPEALFDTIARQAAELCGTPIALMSLVDKERQWFKANVGLPGVNETPRDVAFCAHAILQADLFTVPDARQDSRFARNPLVTGAPGIRFYAGMPLTMPDGSRVGTLCVIDRVPRAMEPLQVERLTGLARIATEALAMRRDLILRALAIRSEDEQQIARSRALYRDLVEQQSELVSLARPDGELVYVNQAYAQLFGREPRQLIGANLFDLVQAQDREAVGHRFHELLSGKERCSGENRNVGAAGQTRWIAWTNSRQSDADGSVLIHSVGRDISEQRQAELALRTAKALLERTGRVAGVGGWEMDLETRAISWSAQTRRIHEVDASYTPSLDEAISFYSPAARPVIEAAVQRAIASGGGWDLELPFVTAKGRPIWVRAVGEIESEGGRPRRLIGAFQDITERREMATRLAEAAEQVHDLYDNAPCGYYSVDAQGRFIRINDLALAWLGCSREEVLHRLGPVDFFSEAGRNLFRLMFPVFKVDGQIGPMEFELRSRDGSSRWVSLSATAVRDADGGFVMSRSVMHDITQVHEARIALSRLAKEQNAMLDNEVVGIVRIRGRTVVWKNSAAERMFGYDPDELLNQAARVLCADHRSFEEEAQAADAALAAKGRHRTQLQMRRKGGELLWIDASGVLLSPATGESMWVLVDISQMKDYQSQVEHLAFHDALTQLPNRLLLADRLQHALAVNARQQGRLAVCCLDLDGFKAVNDRHGHSAGDRLLVEVGRRLQACVRQGDTVARLGGDEFVVLLTPVATGDGLPAILRRIISAVCQPIELPGAESAQVSVSVGVAIAPDDARQPGALLDKADEALYAAKRAGRNRVSFAGVEP